MFKVVITGRPNTGKSSLFNKLSGSRTAIVDELSGVTRDRISRFVRRDGKSFELIDTGGIGIVDVESLAEQVQYQIGAALESADLILFVVDARDGMTALDRDVADRLRSLGKKVQVIANKVDDRKFESSVAEFFRLGLGDPIGVSVKQSLNIDTLWENLLYEIPDDNEETPLDKVVRIAFIGRRNVGKSSMVNFLAKEERVIVNALAGTTRDAVDVLFEKDEKSFIAIDTAGVRKKGKYDTSVDFFSTVRTSESIARCDVAVLVLDAVEGMGRLDKKLADEIMKSHKPFLLVVNKWDLAVSKTTTGEYEEYLAKKLPGINFVPAIFVSAQTGQAMWQMIDVANDLFNQSRERVSTGFLNNNVIKLIKARAPGSPTGKRPVVYFATQTDISPPTIVFSVNNTKLFTDNYRRYILNALREELPYKEVPLRLLFRNAHEKAASEMVTKIDPDAKKKRPSKKVGRLGKDSRGKGSRGKAKR